MITYSGNSMVEAYWEFVTLAQVLQRELPPELLATPPVWPEGQRRRYHIQVDDDGEMELIRFSLTRDLP